MRTRSIVAPNSGATALCTTSTAYQYTGYNTTTKACTEKSWPPTTVSYVPFFDVTTMTDVVTPDYKKRMSKGEIINNPMTKQRTVGMEFLGRYDTDDWQYDTYGCKYRGWRIHQDMPISYWLGSPTNTSWNAPIPDIDVEAMKDICLKDAISKADASDASLYQTLGELQESVDGVISCLVGTANFLKIVRSRKWYKLRRYAKPKELAARWMEVRYGLRPLVFEAAGYIDVIRNINNFGTKRLTFRSSKQVTNSSSATKSVFPSSEWEFQFFATCHREVSVRAGCVANVDINLSSILGLDQPIQSIYALTTLSFVLDWFFNVGKTISSLLPKPSVHMLAKWICISDTITHTVSPSKCILRPGWYGGGTLGGRMYCMREKFERISNPAVSVLPNLDIHMNLQKTIDLGIILKQIFL